LGTVDYKVAVIAGIAVADIVVAVVVGTAAAVAAAPARDSRVAARVARP